VSLLAPRLLLGELEETAMPAQDAQKSEVHRATEDSTTSPASAAKRRQDAVPERDPDPRPGQRHRGDADCDGLLPPDAKVKRDDSDVGGPIEIETPT
jgi:hypothetical protein